MPSWPSCTSPPKVKGEHSGGGKGPGCGCTAASVKSDALEATPREHATHPAPESQSPVPTTNALDASPTARGTPEAAAPEDSPPGRAEGDDDDDNDDNDSFFDADSEASWYDADEGASEAREESEGHSAALSSDGGGEEVGMESCGEGVTAAGGAVREGSSELDGFSTQSQAGDSTRQEGLLLHRAAFDGLLEEVTRLVEAEPTLLSARDTHGNTPLHVAVIRKQEDVVSRLLSAGSKVEAKNTRGWTPMDHAISLRDRAMVKRLYVHRIAEMKAEYKAKKREVMCVLEGMPNCRLKMSWSLGSNVFGILLRKYAPSDTYEVWKLGNYVRVDGTLMGIDDKSKGLIPEWKRGQFSLLFHGATGVEAKSKTYLVSHTTGKWVDLSESKKKAGDTSDMEVSLLMQEGAGKTKMKTTDMRFKPVKSLFGYPVRERVEGWNTTVYEAHARLVAVTTFKTAFDLPEQCSFESYLEWKVAEDVVVERGVDPLSMDALKHSTGKGGRSGAARRSFESNGSGGVGKKKPAPRKVTSRCWMAEDFPMSLKQLLPLMDIIGHANKHVKKVASFMAKYGDKELFPVKIQAPLMLTVFALVSFRQFAALEAGEAAMERGFYELPAAYQKVSAEEMFGTASMMGPTGGRKNGQHGREEEEQSGSTDFEASDFDMSGEYEFTHT